MTKEISEYFMAYKATKVFAIHYHAIYSMAYKDTPSPHRLSQISVCVRTLALACMKWRCFMFVLHVIVPDKRHRVHCKIDCNVAKRMVTEHPV